MSRQIKSLILEPDPVETNPDQWAVRSVGVDPDLGGEETTALQQYDTREAAELVVAMVVRQLRGRTPSFQSLFDPETGRIEYYRDI